MNLSIIFFCLISFSFGQWFNVIHDNVNRSYYMAYPDNINESAPLIINMHGFGGNAIQQQSYTQMTTFAHSENIAVVYPQGVNNSWNVFTFWDNNSNDDVGFIGMMIDDIAENFDIDLNRIYACGMSNGGYMSYRLACDLSDKITAFGSVTGNFMLNNDDYDCLDQDRDIPIIHFHGTADGVVNYYPPSFDGALTIGESIDFWTEYNNLNYETVNLISNNVEVYKYYNETNTTEFVHYKVYGGGHDWFGNSWGFETSAELINFFMQYQLSDFIINQIEGDLNEDSLVNIQDIIMMINIILNNEFFIIADFNSDQTNDILDLIHILNIILN